jgi:hypothetical protein
MLIPGLLPGGAPVPRAVTPPVVPPTSSPRVKAPPGTPHPPGEGIPENDQVKPGGARPTLFRHLNASWRNLGRTAPKGLS